MKRRFAEREVTCSDSRIKPTKAERKENIARLERQLKKKNKEMDTLSGMHDEYDYNRDHLLQLIGSCFVRITQLEYQLKDATSKKQS